MTIAAVANGDTGAAVRTKLNTAFADHIKHNATTTSPGVGDDNTGGYQAGSRWLNTTTGQVWTCRSPATGAAAWIMEDTSDHPGYVSGNWYHLQAGMSLAAGAALVTNTVRLIPFALKARVTLTQLGARLTTASASGNIQLAIYANNGATGRPTGNAVAATGNISTTATGPVAAAFVGGDTTIDPGIYWLAANADNSTVICQTYPTNQVHTGWMIGSSSQSNITNTATTGTLSLSVASQTFGTWSDLTSATFSEINTLSYAAAHFKVA